MYTILQFLMLVLKSLQHYVLWQGLFHNNDPQFFRTLFLFFGHCYLLQDVVICFLGNVPIYYTSDSAEE
jgi:hypothetical protein